MCKSGKVTYTTRKIARQNRNEMHLLYGKKYMIYRCKQCGLFHLTTKTRHGKLEKKGETLQRNVLSIDRFYNVSYRIARIAQERRREMRGADKAGKSNKRRGERIRHSPL